MKIKHYIFVIASALLLACSGSKKYFKAAEKLEKQGLVNDAANYYLESLQRKNSNVEARMKLSQVGQKYVNNMASEFFRNHSTQQVEAALESYERMIDFTQKTKALEVKLDYPKAYDDDYKENIEKFCEKNYTQAYNLVNIKSFTNSRKHINNVKKYNPNYKDISNLDIISVCEPLYQNAVSALENKNYQSASSLLNSIVSKSADYKDTKDLIELTNSTLSKNMLFFTPTNTTNKNEKELEEFYFNQFSQSAQQKYKNLNIINNTPFTKINNATDINNSGNIDLIQAIRKASNADLFFIFDVADYKENDNGGQKSLQKGYQEVKTKVNDTLTKTDYKEFSYYTVKHVKSVSIQYHFKLINAYTNQIIKSNTQTFSANDAIDYNQFANKNNMNINTLYPYNPLMTAQVNQFNPRNWRSSFSNPRNLKSTSELQTEINNKVIQSFNSSLTNIVN